ncbi:hypothetical protein SBA2_670020 [Acidobacteriia bacterium SbA2]|nr:hypothetical protein SBA2_670020 [Acidobacteriia bacterium SbA2]
MVAGSAGFVWASGGVSVEDVLNGRLATTQSGNAWSSDSTLKVVAGTAASFLT